MGRANGRSVVTRTLTRLWLARALIAVVLAWNLQAAVALLRAPARYASGFEVSGVGGEALVRGTGILFLMWQVPYLLALWRPHRHRVSLYEALAMQAIGLAGETVLLLGLPPGHAALRATAGRYIAFDAVGLLLLAGAAALSRGRPTCRSCADGSCSRPAP